MDTDTYETIRDAKSSLYKSLNGKIELLKERVEVLEDKLNIEKKKVPSEVMNEKIINIHPVTGKNTPGETSKITTKKIIERDTNGSK